MSDRDDEREDSRSLISRLPEMVKSMVVLSLGGVFMAEETLRKATRDLKLPREAMDLVLSQAERGKKDLFEAIAREIARAIRDLDVEKLLRKASRDFEVEVDARITLHPRRTKRRAAAKTTRSGARPRFKVRITDSD